MPRGCPAALAMADKLGIEAIAEGVETEEQLELLQAHGCRYAQGFLLGQPMSASAAGKASIHQAPPVMPSSMKRLKPNISPAVPRRPSTP